MYCVVYYGTPIQMLTVHNVEKCHVEKYQFLTLEEKFLISPQPCSISHKTVIPLFFCSVRDKREPLLQSLDRLMSCRPQPGTNKLKKILVFDKF